MIFALAFVLPACADGSSNPDAWADDAGGAGGSAVPEPSEQGQARAGDLGGSVGDEGTAGSAGSAAAPGPDGTPGAAGRGGTAGSGGTAGAGGQAGSAGTGGAAGAGGQAGSAGSAGTGGTAGKGGSAGSGGSAGTGGTAGSGGSAPAGPKPSVSIFVAQGDMGRTVVSCDDGRSWFANQSNDDSARCGNGTDCDHDRGAARGIAFGDGYFYANFGWGTPGSVWRSRNGVGWESVLSGDRSWGGVAFGNGRVVVTSRDPKYSDDRGTSWSDSGPSGVNLWNVRHGNFLPHPQGRFIMAAEDSGSSQVVLSNDGRNWWQPESIPAECGSGVARQGGSAYGNGQIVMLGSNGVACRSSDGGKSWSSTRLGDSVSSQLVWDGEAFMAWSSDSLFRSTDGRTWTQTRTSPPDLKLGPVAVSDDGTFVATNGGWNTAYENQRFYRSTDGVSWQTLPRSAYPASHPIQFIAFGRGLPGVVCPLR